MVADGDYYTALQRNNINRETGASQTFSAGRNRSHSKHNPPVRNNMSNSRNTTTTNSHTADNSRTYLNDAKHNEIHHSAIYGDVTINSQSRVRTHKAMKNLGR